MDGMWRGKERYIDRWVGERELGKGGGREREVGKGGREREGGRER